MTSSVRGARPTRDPDGRRAPEPLRHPVGQSGVSLIETLIAVALSGLVILALAGGFLTLARANAANTAQQAADRAAGNYAESLKSAPYLPCDPANPTAEPDYTAAAGVWTPPAGFSVGVVDVEFWDGGSFVTDCPAADGSLQRLTIAATGPDSERSAQIVKRQR